MEDHNDEQEDETEGGQHPRNIKESEEQGDDHGQVQGSQHMGNQIPAGSGGNSGHDGSTQGGGPGNLHGQGNTHRGRG